MIEKIVMNCVASFKDKVEIKDLGKYNFFYGLNGTGKTIVSEYLRNVGKNNDNDEDKVKFSQCSIEGSKDDILVYNEHFIQENFVETDKQQGIFNLSEENVEAKKEIEKKKEKIMD